MFSIILPLIPIIVLLSLAGLLMGLPIPIGYERGKIKWLSWCHTGMHPMIVYWTKDYGFQTLHPKDQEENKC